MRICFFALALAMKFSIFRGASTCDSTSEPSVDLIVLFDIGVAPVVLLDFTLGFLIAPFDVLGLLEISIRSISLGMELGVRFGLVIGSGLLLVTVTGIGDLGMSLFGASLLDDEFASTRLG
jgi:hypothetical protein